MTSNAATTEGSLDQTEKEGEAAGPPLGSCPIGQATNNPRKCICLPPSGTQLPELTSDAMFVERLMESHAALPLENKQKIDTALHFHGLLHNEMQEHRATTVKITLALLTLFVAVSGWLVVNLGYLAETWAQLLQAFLILLALFGIWAVSVLYRYFLEVGTGVRNTELALGAFAKGVYLGEKGGRLYPDRWAKFGARGWHEPVFPICVAAIVTFAAFAVFSVSVSQSMPANETSTRGAVVTTP